MDQILPVSVLENYPAVDIQAVRHLLETERKKLSVKIVVLDDDPTGTQTVHDVPVYTGWEEHDIEAGFSDPSPLFFILTNSRSLSKRDTVRVHMQIAKRICSVSKRTGKPFLLLSRSDSTLRGHYPLETETLRNVIERETNTETDGEIIVPFFLEGGRYTIGDVQYVRQGSKLVPAGRTEFAQDKSFGFTASNLRFWCEEKTRGKVRADDVTSIGLDELRTCDYDGIERKLLAVHNFGKIVVNAVDYCDLDVFVIAFFRALGKGRRFLFRCAASLVKALGGISDIPLLSRQQLIDPANRNGGIVLVGSHVERTTRQLERLENVRNLRFIEFDQHTVLQEGGLEREVAKTVARAEESIAKGIDVVVHTRRDRLDFPDDDPEKNLALSVAISDAVTNIIAKLRVRPNFIVAKGGITSSDVATKALGMRKARVMGQAVAGVPVWMTGPESKFPSLPFIIFPGNVGTDDALAEVVHLLAEH